jgi:hypothetical protein
MLITPLFSLRHDAAIRYAIIASRDIYDMLAIIMMLTRHFRALLLIMFRCLMMPLLLICHAIIAIRHC